MKHFITVLVFALSLQTAFSQSLEGNIDNLPVKEYTINVKEITVNKVGKSVKAMSIDGTIPGTTLEFNEGEYAVIYVKNEMEVETSMHWHGLLLPNFYDGVPYLTTPPIRPGETLKYEFPIKQAGTYWYHSHTMLQEQRGVFGAFIIHPKKKESFEYDKELVLMLSDWTNENPMNVLRNLKRGNEWYGIKKGTSTPLNRVIAQGGFGAQLNFWKQRMEGADIADIYYPTFLINGENNVEYPEFKPGEKVRIRIVNGSASTSFWMTFGGEMPTLVSADGLNVVPIKKNKTFIAIAEAYDYIVTIPEEGKVEFKIVAQDGSGGTSAYLGTGNVLHAEEITRPDKIAMMKSMAKMDMKMGAPALKYRPNKDERFEMRAKYGMKMNADMDHSDMKMEDQNMSHSEMDHSTMNASEMSAMDSEPKDEMSNTKGMSSNADYNYDYLKSKEKTAFSKDIPVTEILLNLTGNMQRYIWSMNGVPLSESDNINIKGDQVTRITLNNLTMMHHPMHLHGHFFRVLNKNGAYSPLKHTVNVPPMESVTLEFYGDEYGDWIFHCHVLYHMMGGMASVLSYGTPRDPRMKDFPVSNIIEETNKFYTWGTLDVASHKSELNLVASDFRNQFNVSAEYGWNKNLEAEFTYERYLFDFLRVFGGVNVENEIDESLDEIETTAVLGVRYLTPFLFNLDVRMDSNLRPQIGISREIMIFPRTVLFGEYEYQADFGWVTDFSADENYRSETVWNVGLEYFLSRDFSLTASYDNRFGTGGGVSFRF
ncbi:multicopper oxidase domain-containing protein [Formosa undariae]|uniref:Multicopper oxidase domain-containing protein n=1 Tax=Formosa undariae TaxID=1325436 RepID=A0ABV5F472_9FLAO